MEKSLVTSTNDSRNAHDFKSEKEALEWMKKKRVRGHVVELTDSGVWPVLD